MGQKHSSSEQKETQPSNCEPKIMVIGKGTSVGKSALTIRFINGHFVEEFDETVTDSYRKQVVVDHEPIVVDVVDVGTDILESSEDMLNQYVNESSSFIFTFSVMNADTFTGIKELHQKVLDLKESASGVLAATKTDFPESDWVVSRKEAEDLATEWGLPIFFTSAKAQVNVQETFEQVIRSLRNRSVSK